MPIVLFKINFCLIFFLSQFIVPPVYVLVSENNNGKRFSWTHLRSLTVAHKSWKQLMVYEIFVDTTLLRFCKLADWYRKQQLGNLKLYEIVWEKNRFLYHPISHCLRSLNSYWKQLFSKLVYEKIGKSQLSNTTKYSELLLVTT